MGDKSLDLLKEAGFDVKGLVQVSKNSNKFSLTGNVINAIDKLPVKRADEEYEEPIKKVKVKKRFNARSLMINELKGVYFGKNNRNNIN